MRHSDTGDMPVCQSMHRFAYNTTGFEVQPAMKMVGTYLAEIA